MIKIKNINIEIRAYLRANPHFTDDMVAEKFNVSLNNIRANKAHITMRTDTDNPQERAKAVRSTAKKGLTLIKTPAYELRINEDGQFSRIDLIAKRISKVTDSEAKAIMITQLKIK
jgi:CRISPR/Cas system-associated endoribonuclease Cas2